MLEWFVKFVERHQGVLLTSLFAMSAWLFIRWDNSRPAKLSARARRLLKRLQADATHDVKGITLHRYDGMVNYWPFRVLGSDKVELGMFYELRGEYLEVVQAVEEMLSKGYLTQEHETEGGVAVYRLKD